jgi:hypothetical protein
MPMHLTTSNHHQYHSKLKRHDHMVGREAYICTQPTAQTYRQIVLYTYATDHHSQNVAMYSLGILSVFRRWFGIRPAILTSFAVLLIVSWNITGTLLKTGYDRFHTPFVEDVIFSLTHPGLLPLRIWENNYVYICNFQRVCYISNPFILFTIYKEEFKLGSR